MAAKKARQEESRHRGLWEVATKFERRAIGGTISVAIALVFLAGGIAWYLDQKISKVDDRLASIAGDVREMMGRVNLLGLDLMRAKASSLGLQNASIRSVDLHPGVQFTASVNLPTGQTYNLRYTLLEITRTSAGVLLDGKVGTNTISGVRVDFALTPGVATRIPVKLGDMPDLYIVVLERPTPDSAIIATGLKASQAQRS